jgi:hypothetical protein
MGSKNRKKKLFHKEETFITKSVNFIKSIDVYGKSITMTHNKRDKFKTTMGGIASIFVTLLIASYVSYLFYIMFAREDTSFSSNSIYTNIFEDTVIYQPGLNKFDFAFLFEANGVDYMNDPTAFNVSLEQVQINWSSTDDEDTPYVETATAMEMQV